MTFAERLVDLYACGEARVWVGTRDIDAAWAECQRGDWMLWLAGRAGVDRKTLVLAACDCAETALKHVPAGEDRPRKAIETARAWCRGDATIEQVRAAAYDAYAAACAAADAAADAAAYAAYAAADAVYAVYDAYDAAYAAADAYAATDVYAAGAARMRSRAESAALVRARIPLAVIHAALAAGDGR